MLQGITQLLHQMQHWIQVRSTLITRAAAEILLIFLIVYAFMRLLQGTRGAGVLKGLTVFMAILAAGVVFVARQLQLERVNWVLTSLAPVIIIPLFILFQPEIRRALIRVGQNPWFRLFLRPDSRFTDELVEAVFSLSRDKIGALIAIERQVELGSYVERGVRLDSEVSAELIKSVFWPGAPLHDGAVVIREQRILAASCLFPLTDNPDFSSDLGTRHRAGIGVTEESDAAAIVVSEQTGRVSLAFRGQIQRDLDEKALRSALEEIAAQPAQAQ